MTVATLAADAQPIVAPLRVTAHAVPDPDPPYDDELALPPAGGPAGGTANGAAANAATGRRRRRAARRVPAPPSSRSAAPAPAPGTAPGTAPAPAATPTAAPAAASAAGPAAASAPAPAAVPRPDARRLPPCPPMPPPTPAALRLVPPLDGDDDWEQSFDPVRTPREELEDPLPRAAMLTRALLEAMCGTRPLAQLTKWVTPEVLAVVQSSVVNRGARPGPTALRRVLVSEPVPGVAEVTAVVDRGTRAEALALRLEGLDGRWLVTALQRA